MGKNTGDTPKLGKKPQRAGQLQQTEERIVHIMLSFFQNINYLQVNQPLWEFGVEVEILEMEKVLLSQELMNAGFMWNGKVLLGWLATVRL